MASAGTRNASSVSHPGQRAPPAGARETGRCAAGSADAWGPGSREQGREGAATGVPADEDGPGEGSGCQQAGRPPGPSAGPCAVRSSPSREKPLATGKAPPVSVYI